MATVPYTDTHVNNKPYIKAEIYDGELIIFTTEDESIYIYSGWLKGDEKMQDTKGVHWGMLLQFRTKLKTLLGQGLTLKHALEEGGSK